MINLILSNFAASATVNCIDDNGKIDTCSTGLPKVQGGSGELHTVLTLLFGVAAVISVLMILIGAMTFITSGGNPESATKARETIIYAVVGLVVSLSAEALVAFVLFKL